MHFQSRFQITSANFGKFNNADFCSRKRKNTSKNIVTSPHVPQNDYCLKIVMFWLVVLTISKKISPWEGLSHILWKTNMFQTTNQCFLFKLHSQGNYHLPLLVTHTVLWMVAKSSTNWKVYPVITPPLTEFHSYQQLPIIVTSWCRISSIHSILDNCCPHPFTGNGLSPSNPNLSDFFRLVCL